MAEGKPSYRYVPNICRDYNTKTCTRPDCTRPHLCLKFFDPTSFCAFRGNECEFSHNIFNPQSKSCLQRAGFNTKVKPGELKYAYLTALKEKNRPPKEAPIRVPRICLNFNQGLCQDKQCHLLHICQAYIESTCVNNFETCPFSHDIFAPHIRSRLRISGLNVDQRPRQVLADYRRALRSQPGFADSSHPQRESNFRPERKIGAQTKSYSTTDISRLHMKTSAKKQEQKSRQTNLGRADPPAAISRAATKYHIGLNDDAVICLSFLTGRCDKGPSCPDHHQPLPYLWQYKSVGTKWGLFNRDSTQLLEQTFCDVEADVCRVIIEGQTFIVDFDDMRASSDDVTIPVRRLSTASYLTTDHRLATHWTWFWESSDGWVVCGQKDQRDNNINAKKIQTHLEKSFNNCPSMSTSLTINEFMYVFSFADMHQMNDRTGAKRRLRHRPIFVSPEDVKKIASRLQELPPEKPERVARANPLTPLPDWWTPMAGEEMKKVLIDRHSKEFIDLQRRFQDSMPKSMIVQIERIQNPSLWFAYDMKSDRLGREYGPANINERRLFHGTTPTAVDPICEQNFDWRLYGSAVGARYGEGAYFAVNAEKADQYTKPDDGGHYFMFYARVLVGKSTKGDRMMRRPPYVDSQNPYKLFDSCTDDPHNPSIFVLFDKAQYYPEYIIKYSHLSAANAK